MRQLGISALLVFLAVPLFAAHECEADLSALRALYAVRYAMLSSHSEYAVQSEIDDQIDLLREPFPEGGFRWIEYVRPLGEGPVAKREHLVASVQGSDDPDFFEAAADHPYAVRVAVPRKRSLTRANKEAYVGTLVVRYWVDGDEREMEKRIDQWFAPDTSKTFDLGVIADRAEASLEASTREKNRKESLVEIHFRQAVARDNPDNPNYSLIETLKKMRAQSDLPPAAIDYEIAKLEKLLFPDMETIPLAAFITRLRQAEAFIRSENPEEQEKGKKALAEIVRMVR